MDPARTNGVAAKKGDDGAMEQFICPSDTWLPTKKEAQLYVSHERYNADTCKIEGTTPARSCFDLDGND